MLIYKIQLNISFIDEYCLTDNVIINSLGTRIRTINDFGFVVLEISPVYPEDSGLYSCRAFNKVGEAVTTCTIKCSGKQKRCFL